jgi:hypothetical protein
LPSRADEGKDAMNALSSIALSGLAAATQRADRAAGRIAGLAAATDDPAAAENLAGPAGDIVEQMQAGYAFDASLCVIRTDHAMVGTLLDVMA